MGSILKQPSAAGGGAVWHEQVFDSISQLTKNPSLLKLQPGASILHPGGVMHNATVVRWVWEYGICDDLKNELVNMALLGSQFSYKEYSYDWRQNLIATAKKFGEWLTQYGFKNDTTTGIQQKEDAPRLALVCHSMGGLVAAIALRKGYVNPANVYCLITIGSPLAGAPAAFRGLYDVGYLPGLEFVERAINWRLNRRKCYQILLEAFQSFYSSYQLLPPGDFVELYGVGTVNPLSCNSIPADKRQAALEVHQLLNGIESFLQGYPHLKYLLIYSTNPNSTEVTYYATENHVSKTFENVRDRDWDEGDGTVPAKSASLNNSGPCGYPVTGAKHMSMCNDHRIIQAVKNYLASA